MAAASTLVFKQELVTANHWGPYGLVAVLVIIIFGVLFYLTQKKKNTSHSCLVLESLSLPPKCVCM